MGALDKLSDFFPASWLDRGMLVVPDRPGKPSTFFASIAGRVAHVAAMTAVVAAANVLVPATAVASALNTADLNSAEVDSATAAVEEIRRRIETKLALFSVPDRNIDSDLLAEARLTLESRTK